MMNHWEIDQAVETYQKHPVLGKATRFLQNFRDLVDSMSDGWAYWPKPRRAAQKLMLMIENPETATGDELKWALKPIKAFATRNKLTLPKVTDVKKVTDHIGTCYFLMLDDQCHSIYGTLAEANMKAGSL